MKFSILKNIRFPEMLLITLLLTVASNWVGFALNVGLSKIYWLVLYVAMAIVFRQINQRHFIYTLAIVLGSVWIASQLYDRSWDGSCYHQEAIIQLADGYNPFKGWFQGTGSFVMPLNHYPKNAWLSAIGIYKILGNPEAAKAINLLAVFASFGALLGSFKALFPSETKKQWLYTALVFSNPVVWFELFTSQVDGFSYCWLIVIGIGVIRILWNQEKYLGWLYLIGGTVLVHNKFTQPVFACLMIALIAMVYLWNNRDKFKTHTFSPLSNVLKIGLLVSIVFLLSGINPYLRNTKAYGHPFHPAMGPNKVDLVGFMKRDELQMNRVVGFLYSNGYVGEFKNGIKSGIGKWVNRIIRLPETSEGSHGGFGIGIWVLLVLLLIAALHMQYLNPQYRVFLLAAVLFFSSIFLIHETYNARFVVHGWLGLAIVAIVVAQQANWVKYLLYLPATYAIYFILFNTYIQFKTAKQINGDISKLSATVTYQVALGSKPAFRKVLENKGISFEIVDSLLCDKPIKLEKSTLQLCAE